MKKILSIVIFILLATSIVVADNIDTILTLAENVDSLNVDMPNDIEDESQILPFWMSVLSSMLAAIITLFLFFRLFRPRVFVAPTIACFKEKNKEQKFQILIKNKGIFEVNDVKICMEGTFDMPNGDIKSFSIIEKPIHILSLKGVFHNSNLNEECYTFSIPSKDAIMPMKLILTVLSQHSVSSIVAGRRFEFTQVDYKEGSYEKGLFIPKGLTYKQVLCRDSLLCMKWIFTISIAILLLEALLLFVLKLLSIQNGIIIFATTFITTMLFAILWQQYIYAKGNAYNGGYINQNIQINMASINMDKSSSKDEKNKIPEEVPYVEIEKK